MKIPIREAKDITEKLVADTTSHYRMSGQTTRLIDAYIQLLFKNSIVYIQDHYPSENAHRDIFKRVYNRLQLEYAWIVRERLKVDNKNYIIELI